MSEKKQHPEWEKENSLTCPSDRIRENRWRPEQGAPVLTEPEVSNAMETLNNTDFTKKFPRVDRTYADPPPPMQGIGLISFTPAKGATPNEKGVFGFAKLRGNYATPMEADQRAEFLIRNVDSYHQIYHTHVGRPFPMTDSSDYSAETSEVEIRKEMTNSVSSNIKNKRDEERQVVNEMKEREEQLLEESRKAQADDGTGEPDQGDPYELYITLCVKKAQLSWNYLEHLKKVDEIKAIVIKTRKELEELDLEHPDFSKTYFDKYMEARKKAGLDETVRETQDNFMKYMVTDVKLPGIDTPAHPATTPTTCHTTTPTTTPTTCPTTTPITCTTTCPIELTLE